MSARGMDKGANPPCVHGLTGCAYFLAAMADVEVADVGSLTRSNLASGSIKLANGKGAQICENNSWLCAIWRQSQNHHVH